LLISAKELIRASSARRRWHWRRSVRYFDWITDPRLAPTAEYFDCAAVPPEIAELLAEWPDIDLGTAKLIRAAIMSRSPRRLRMAWTLLAARAEPARTVR
jgi:hypothetical protein